MTELLQKDLTGRIIGVYYTTFNRLSQTYPEYIYEKSNHVCCWAGRDFVHPTGRIRDSLQGSLGRSTASGHLYRRPGSRAS